MPLVPNASCSKCSQESGWVLRVKGRKEKWFKSPVEICPSLLDNLVLIPFSVLFGNLVKKQNALGYNELSSIAAQLSYHCLWEALLDFHQIIKYVLGTKNTMVSCSHSSWDEHLSSEHTLCFTPLLRYMLSSLPLTWTPQGQDIDSSWPTHPQLGTE